MSNSYLLSLDGKPAAILRSPTRLGSDNEVRGIATAKAERGELMTNIPAGELRFCEVTRFER